MIVEMLVNFNGKMVPTRGNVVKRLGQVFLVDFSHDGIKFGGWWRRCRCQIISRRK